jgi:DUF2950 family protein
MSDFFNPPGVRNSLTRRLLGLSALLIACVTVSPSAYAEDAAAQQVFPSPSAAASALTAAAQADDMKMLNSILGSEADQVISSGDPVADNDARDNFVSHYRQMHRFAYDDQGRVILYIGADNWPYPIPLVKKDGGWIFDTAAGKKELLYRRIGRNELFTINVLEDLGEGQEEYSSEAHDSENSGQFAQKIMSDNGKRNGLYWETADGQPESPIGPLVASASTEGYKKDNGGSASPFHGYYYRVLTRQGKNAPGGPKDYFVNGKMTGGFAFLAYPAEYGASGVMTFMINQDGVIVQKDLGNDTSQLAGAIGEYNPDETWQEVNQ